MHGPTIAGRFEQVVRATPTALAVKTPRDAVSYGELDARANRIARKLRELAQGAPEPIVLRFEEQGIHAIAAILGVLKARHIYVPLDCAAPVDGTVLADLGARIVLTDRATLAAHVAVDATVIAVDTLTGPTDALDVPADADDPAYVFYTSGSTGRPKGVVDNHRNVLHNVMRYTNALHITAADRLTLLQAIHFSGSVSSLFGALLNGATVCPFHLRAEGLARVNTWLCEEGITIYHSVPAIFRGWVGSGPAPRALRVVRLEGDLASKRDVELFRRHLPASCMLAHGLGATETGLSCQLQLTTRDEVGAVVPVGRPLPDMHVRIIDDSGADVAPGASGEIAVASRFLAVGYWRDDDLTRRRFSVDPAGGALRTYRTGDVGRIDADGNVEYLGRKDAVEKINGQHLQVAAIEAALVGLAGVEEAAIATHRDAGGEAVLVGYVVVANRATVSLPAIRQQLLATLPSHMVPRRLVTLARLPLDGNGKVDRRALPPPAPEPRHTAAIVEPGEDPLHARLAPLWSDVLGGLLVGPHDDFFALGGDSLAAVRLAAMVSRELGCELRPAMLVEARTIAALATALRGAPSRVTDETLFVVPSHTGGELQLAHLARAVDVHCLAADGAMERCAFDIPATAAAYVTLLRRLKPHGPYRLGGVCYGALVAYEMARQLIAAGEHVRDLVLFAVRPAELRRLVPARLVRRQRLFERYESARAIAACVRAEGWAAGARRVAHGMAEDVRVVAGTTTSARAIRQRRRATERFAPAALPMRVTFFIARGDAWIFGSDPAAHLRALSRAQVVVHVVSGGRHTLLDPGHVRDTVARLREVLRG